MRGITIFFLLALLVISPSVASAKPGNTSHAQQIEHVIRSYLPDESIDVRQINRSFALSGAVSSSEAAAKAVQIAKQYVSKDSDILNFITLKTAQQVMLRVRIGEVERKALKTLRTVFNPSTRGERVSGHIDRMERAGTFKMLAEPTLVAISGEKAEFTTGGELPILSADGSSLQYKPYGVKVHFLPLVMAENRIRLEVNPEVTEAREKGGIHVKGHMVPSMTSHSAKTTIELAPGESFMIAGLIKDDVRANTKEQLFGESFMHHERELVMLVTPYLVDPVPGHELRLPTDNFSVSDELDVMFQRHFETNMKQKGQKVDSKGQMGYIVE